MPESGPTEVGAKRHLTTFALWLAAGSIASCFAQRPCAVVWVGAFGGVHLVRAHAGPDALSLQDKEALWPFPTHRLAT